MEETKRIGTPYDDVFRTLLNDCSSLIIPVINEVFGECYSGKEQVVFSANEHYLNRQDGDEEERVTDSSFRILGKMRPCWNFSKRSTDRSGPGWRRWRRKEQSVNI